MSNSFVSLPVPVSNGVGASVDVSLMGRPKTILVIGAFDANVTVEVSEDDVVFSPLASFQQPDVHEVDVAACFLRVKIDGYVSGPLPVVGVGSPAYGTVCVALPVPVGNGVGAAVDTSALGSFKTIIVGPSIPENAQITVEGSVDGTNFGVIADFINPDNQSIVSTLAKMRVRVSGYETGTMPTVGVAAINDPASAGPNIVVVDESACIPATADIVRFATDETEPQLYLPSVAAGPDGRTLTFVHTSGSLDAILLPDSLDEGVDGEPGASYTFPALDQATTFQADVANAVWHKISSNP